MKKSPLVPAIQEYMGGKLWHLRESGEMTVGLTAATLEEIGTVQSVEFPESSGLVEQGDVIAIVEGENDTFEVTAPTDGMILEVNDLLEDEPTLIADDPTEQGWLVKIEPDDVLEEEEEEQDDEQDDESDEDDEDSDEEEEEEEEEDRY
ncbi:MAG: glycine cleavage system protein H [Oligoflexia bacterium]